VQFDPRIVSEEKLDRAKTALVDTHSLYVLAKELKDGGVPTFDVSALAQSYGGRAFANVIQNIVLYDTIIVDSLLFQVHSDVSTACELFPDIIKGIYVRCGVRRKIGGLVGNIAGWDRVDQPPFGISRQEWGWLQLQDASEKPLMDMLDSVAPDLFPPEYAAGQELQDDLPPFPGLPLCCTNSMMTLARAHFYLELARELGVALSIDPIRSRYFEVLLARMRENIQRGTPEKVLAFFEERVLRQSIDQYPGLISVDLSIPPVAELVVTIAKRKRCSLHTAALEVRESKNAVRFRQWCAQLRALEGQGRAAAKEQAEMLDELKQVCEIWRKDVHEEVEYKTRRLNLEKLPLIGQVLKALNMHESVVIKDPVLRPSRRYSYFLFLNDLIRQPRN